MDGDVPRHKWIKVEAITHKGRKWKKKLDGWQARIFQHEYDHLDGIVFTDRVEEKDKSTIKEGLDALVQAYKGGEDGIE